MFRLLFVTMAISLMSCVSFVSLAHADDDTATQRIAELENEVAMLRAQLKLAKASRPESTSNDDKAEAKSPVKSVSSLADLLKMLPPEAQADRNGNWSAPAAKEADERLVYSFWGTPFNADMVIHLVKITENRATTADGAASPWKVEVQFKTKREEYLGNEIDHTVNAIVLYGDQQLTRRAERLKSGQSVRVRGEIKTLQPQVWRIGSPSRAKYLIHLRDVSIAGLIR